MRYEGGGLSRGADLLAAAWLSLVLLRALAELFSGGV